MKLSTLMNLIPAGTWVHVYQNGRLMERTRPCRNWKHLNKTIRQIRPESSGIITVELKEDDE